MNQNEPRQTKQGIGGSIPPPAATYFTGFFFIGVPKMCPTLPLLAMCQLSQRVEALEKRINVIEGTKPLPVTGEIVPDTVQQHEMMEKIIATVAEKFRLAPGKMTRRGRGCEHVSWPRQIAMFLTREMTVLSFPQIGNRFHKDHSTILHGIKRVRQRMETEPKTRAFIDKLSALLQPK